MQYLFLGYYDITRELIIHLFMREKFSLRFKRETFSLEREKREEIEKKIDRIEKEIEMKTGRKVSPKKIFFEKEPGKKSPRSVYMAEYKKTRNEQMAEKRTLEYLKEESVLSNKICSRVEGKRVYLNLKELEKVPMEGLYSVLYSIFIIYPRFEKEILPELEKKAENLKGLGIEKEVLETSILELASFIFAENFVEKEVLKKNLQAKVDAFREKKNYTLSHKIFKGEIFRNFIKEGLVELNCWLEESKTLKEKELEKEIRKEIRRLSSREDFKKEAPQISPEIENLVENFGEKLRKKFLGVDLNYYFPPEIPPERLARILEPKIEERKELKCLLKEVKASPEIYPELLKKIKANLIITKEDIEKYVRD